MLLAFLDVGSNAANMLVTDLDPSKRGDLPMVAHAWKRRTRLAETLRLDGVVGMCCAGRLFGPRSGELSEDHREQAERASGRARCRRSPHAVPRESLLRDRTACRDRRRSSLDRTGSAGPTPRDPA